MKFVEMNKNIKQEVKPLYNIKGDDFYLIKQALNNLKSILITDMVEFNFNKINAEKLKKEQALELILTLPLMSEHRIVVFENPSQEVVKFLNSYNFESNETVVVCLHAQNLNSGEEIDCSALDRKDISKFILNYLSKSNLSIEEQALDYIIDATNGNMDKIINELNKITSYSVDAEIVTMDIVTNLIANTNEYTIYMLTNAIDTKNYSSYQNILNDMTKAQSHAEIFAYMGKYFKRMQSLCLNKDDDKMSKALGLKPYAIKISRQNITRNGVKYYIGLYEKYVNLDYKIKSGQISASNALYELIF